MWDADLESWLLIMERQHREDMLTVVEPLQPIGYSGRSGGSRNSNAVQIVVHVKSNVLLILLKVMMVACQLTHI